jgi:hypothetical protein
MLSHQRKTIDPMCEGHPEPFQTPRTIPTAWDLSDLFSSLDMPQAEVNGTAYDKVTGLTHDHTDESKNPV